jgi:hypothetical protein
LSRIHAIGQHLQGGRGRRLQPIDEFPDPFADERQLFGQGMVGALVPEEFELGGRSTEIPHPGG